jgi:hypothetical protein
VLVENVQDILVPDAIEPGHILRIVAVGIEFDALCGKIPRGRKNILLDLSPTAIMVIPSPARLMGECPQPDSGILC